MKLLLPTTVACLLTFSALQAAEISTPGKIISVTVYPGSAKVLRQAAVDLPAGSSDILITGLPLNMHETSLRVSGKSDSATVLSSVSLHRDIHAEVVLEQEKQLRQQIEQQQQLQQQTKDNKQQHLQQIEFIRAMGTGGQGDKPSSYLQLPPDQWQHAWKLMRETSSEARQQIRETDEQFKQIGKRIEQLQAQLKQIATNQRSTRSALLEVKAAEDTRFELQLTYQVNGARWAPVYDAYLDTESSKLQIRTLAQISQRTGEDWHDVQVTLSTLRPTAGTRLPPLDSWLIDFYTPPDPAIAYSDGIKSKRSQMRMAAAPMAERAMQQEQAALVSTDYSAKYQLPTSISLDSGSDKRRFALSSQDYSAHIELASVPRMDPRVMLTGKITYTSAAPLLAGNMSLYRDGNFVGNTQLKETQGGEEVRLSFGEDDKVKIDFHPDPDRKKQSGLLFGKRKVVERNYLVSIHNNHQQEKSIMLYEALPVAADEKIKVELSGEKPNKLDVDDKKGIVSWTRRLPPGKEVQLRYGYSVAYPEDREIQGL
jgi:uncharacterized protein (TIGR02231 family)